MRNSVWNYIYLWHVNIFYYKRYCNKLNRLNFFLKFGSSAITMVAIACWGQWQFLSALWMGAITLAQITGIYAESKDLTGEILRLNYWLDDAYKIINKITDLWDEIDDLDDLKIRCHLCQIRDEWSALDSRFLVGIDSYDSKVLALAETEAADLLNTLHIANHEAEAESKEEVTV